MNQMDDRQRCHPYHQTRTSNDDFQRQYKHYQSSSLQHNDRLNHHKQMNFPSQQTHAMPCSYFPTAATVPLMSNKIVSPSTVVTAIPQERQSWIRSVKKTKTNESTEQKTQYLETMLRMPQQQQKSSLDSSSFDRIRFADPHTSTIRNMVDNNHPLDKNSFHLIGNIDNHDEISTIEKMLFDHEIRSTTNEDSSQIIECEPIVQTNFEPSPWSGFLIDNCDEEQLPPASPPSYPILHSVYSTIEEPIVQNPDVLNERQMMLVNELDTAAAEQRRELHRQNRLHRKLRKQKKAINQKISNSNSRSTVNNNSHQEFSSDWIIEYDSTGTNQISQLTNMIKKTSANMTDKDKVTQINIILNKIQKQQRELRKLRQHVMSMLDEGSNTNSNHIIGQKSQDNQDLLMKFLNQPLTSGCWLCSGKRYTEIATQCNHLDEQ